MSISSSSLETYLSQMTWKFETRENAQYIFMDRIFSILLKIGTRENEHERCFGCLADLNRASCCGLVVTTSLTGQRCRRKRPVQRRPESSSSSSSSSARVPSPRAWWWHKRAGRAKDVNTRAIFWYFVRRLTSRTLRYYRPALILGTRRRRQWRQSRALLLLSAACTGNRGPPRDDGKADGGRRRPAPEIAAKMSVAPLTNRPDSLKPASLFYGFFRFERKSTRTRSRRSQALARLSKANR